MNTNKKKTTRGRQKIEIQKIENVGNRQVTFTKRRGGLFKKAAEFCILNAAEMAVIVKSPGGRTFAFGHPGVGPVLERYLHGNTGLQDVEVTDDITRRFNKRYNDLAKELAAEKRLREVILGSGNVPNGGFWWEEPIDGMGLEELESYAAALEELRKKVSMRADEMMLMRASNSMQYSTPLLAMNPINSENSSELANHFINQPHDYTSNSLFPLGYDFGQDHAN